MTETRKLISYVRDEHGKIMATLVAISSTQFGAAFANPKDKVVKHLGVAIATERALKGKQATCPNRMFVTPSGDVTSLLFAVKDEAIVLKTRAEKYFKHPES